MNTEKSEKLQKPEKPEPLVGLMPNQESAKELEITEENFHQYFFDARRFNPKKGHVLAAYSAVAEFTDGPEKRQIIELMRTTDKAEPASQVMRKLLFAKERDAFRVPREICEDLLGGMSVEEVASKSYKFIMEAFYYTNPELIPTDDPHWSCISLLNLEEHLARKEVTVEARLVDTDEWKDESINSKLEGETSGKEETSEEEK